MTSKKEKRFSFKILKKISSEKKQNDKKFINSLMIQEIDPSKTASWITKPRRGINNQEIDYSYVDLN